jgi:hypothetical protein
MSGVTNIFDSVTKDLNATQEKILGPQYDYAKQIKTPNELGMSSQGSFESLGKNVNGMVSYVELLVTGYSAASRTGGPLGNKFFLKTGALCKDKSTKKDTDRYIYINNVPDGSIPFISSGLDANFNTFKGLVPGTLSNVSHINPLQILQSFMAGNKPECQPVTMETITVDNVKGSETRHLTTLDIQSTPACWFNNKKNPITNNVCRETFSNISNNETSEDILTRFYFSTLGIFGIYMLIKLFEKKS